MRDCALRAIADHATSTIFLPLTIIFRQLERVALDAIESGGSINREMLQRVLVEGLSTSEDVDMYWQD